MASSPAPICTSRHRTTPMCMRACRLVPSATPAKTDYLYFVANTQGGHFFAATLVEHNRNVTKYRRLLAGLPADPPTPPPALPAAHKQATKVPRKHAATKKSPGKHKAYPKQQQVASQ